MCVPVRFPLALACWLAVSLSLNADQPEPPASPEHLAIYEKEVLPVLQANCLKCHGADPKKIRGGLNLTSRRALLAGGDTGPAVDPADPEASLLLKSIRYGDDSLQMPPSGKLPAEQLAVLERWVKAGAAMPAGGDDGATHDREHAAGPDRDYWAFRQVRRPPVPTISDPAWAQNPIDAFILAKLDEKGLKPVGPANKAALCRRAYYDLTGLPPTPDEVDAFVANDSPAAFAELVDELLASPQYGEKWGRHWLDVVRYAETNGYERDGPKPFAWRYRDYVIRSFNADKPFDRFLREQIAGDEIAPGDPDAVIATGFYRLGLWDDEPADPQLALFDGYDDLVTVTSQGILGLTLNCCRCHDHKGDHFPQADYYRLAAFFREVRPYGDLAKRSIDNRSCLTDISPAEQRATYEAEMAKRQSRIEELDAELRPLEDGAIRRMPPEDQLAVQDGHRDRVVKKVPEFLAESDRERYEQLRRERRGLEKLPAPERDFALSVNACEVPPPAVHILIRGNPGSPGKEVRPGFPEVFGIPDPTLPDPPAGARSSGRRTALADWLASKDNPMTARVIVNRVWGWHFGRGLVPTPNDFGKLGEPCSHPELLDWLAADFTENGWSFKRLHRLIMLSNTYRLSSAADADNLRVDAGNVFRWRFEVRRLTAEEVRDSILTVSGNLNGRMFGPGVFPKIPNDVLAGQSRPGEGWTTSPPEEANRRSVYVHVKRSLQVPILATHDQADTDSSCPVRYTTTVPTQALGMLNGEFTNDQARTFAGRLSRECPGDLEHQVSRGIRLTTGRVPPPEEVARDVAFVRAMRDRHGLSEETALARYALLLLNANEFVYVD